MQLSHTARENIRFLLEQCNVAYEVTPFDEGLYQECIDDAIQRGYPVDGDLSVLTYLREGVTYSATAGVHLLHRPTQILIALYTSCVVFLDDAAFRFPAELPNISLFSKRFIKREPQGNGVLDALADILRRTPDSYAPVASQLIITSTLNYVIANLLEYETVPMKISSATQMYPEFQRNLSGDSQAYGVMIFPQEVPPNDYVQAIPEIISLIDNINDICSFYKEEQAGETTNQISMLAACTGKSKLETYGELTKTTIGIYKRIVKILEGSPKAHQAFTQFVGGYVRFHTSLARYQLEDLGL